jgi:fibronectin-binding autotransporter adhesin
MHSSNLNEGASSFKLYSRCGLLITGCWQLRCGVFAIIFSTLLFAGAAHGADIVWTNIAGGNFATAANWNPNQVPTSGDTAWITNDGTYTITFNTSATIASLMLGGSSGTQTLSHPSGTLTLTGSSMGSDHAIYNLSGGGLTGSGSLALAGSFNWTGGIVGASGATLVVAANGGLAVSGVNGKSFAGVTLVNNNLGTWSGGQVSCSGTAVFSNAPTATFDFQGDGSAFVLLSGTPLIANSGTMRKTAGAGTTTCTVRCNNAGSVLVNSGTLALTLADSSGSFSTSLGNTLSINGLATLLPSATIDGVGNFAVTSGTLTNNGSFHVDGTNTFTGGSITFNGSCFITNSPLVINGGTAIFNGTGLITPGSLAISAGNLQGSMPVTVPGMITWTGGVIGTGSSLVVTANGGLTISGINSKNLTGGMLVNNGVATWSGGQLSCLGTAVFSNAPSALLDFQADGNAFVVISGNPLLVNSGILRKSAGTGTTTLTVRCNNAGSVQVNSGTLALVPTDSNGSFTASAGNTLSFSGAATFSASASIEGAGNFTVTSGTFTNNGTFHIDGTNTFASGTVAFNGNCFITNNPMVISSGTVIFNGSGIVAPTLLNLSGGSLQGSMTLTIPGLITWTAGTIGASGSSLAVVANGGLSVIGATPKSFNGGMLVNNALAIWNGAQLNFNGSPVFSNAPSATLDFQADGNAFILNSGTPVLLNSGILKKSTGTGTTTSSVRCNNAGSVQVNSGTLALALGDSSGSFALPADTTLSVSGIAVLSPTASIDGAGNFIVTGGTITNNGTFHVDGTNTFTGGSITFSGNSFITNNPMVINGGTVVFGGSGIVAPTLLNLSAGSLQGSMTVTVPGFMSWTGGIIGANNSSLVVAANGGLSITGAVTKSLNGGTLANSGLATWSGTQVTCNNNAVLSNAPSGTLDLQADGLAFAANIGNPLVVNSGTLRKSAGTGATTISVRCSNAGLVQVNSGTLVLTLADSTGAFGVAAGTTLSVNGTAVLSATASIDGAGNFTVTIGSTITNNGAFHIDGTNTFTGGTMALNGSCFITNGPIVINGGIVVFNGTGTITPASLSLSTGSLLGNMTITVLGLTTWTVGTIGSAGSSLLVSANGGLTMSTASVKSFNGGTLLNNGVATWTGGQLTCINNAVFSNAPAALLDLQSDGSAFGTFSGNPRIMNAGILRKSSGSGTTTVGIPCNNSGSVEVNSGTLALTVGDSSGSFTVAPSNLLSVNGTALLSPSASISGAGNFAVTTGATITNNGSLHIDGTNTFSGGTIAFNGNCILTNAPVIVNGGTVVVSGAGTIAPGSLTISAGSLLGNMTVTVSGPMTWTAGALGSAASSLLVVANGGLTFSGSAVKSFSGGTLLNNGAATWSGGQITCINNALWSNAPTAMLDLQADGSAFGTFAGTPSMVNAGTLRKSAGTGTSSVGINCTNFGLVQVNTGTLRFDGNFIQKSGQTVFNGGSYLFLNAAQLLGGTLQGSGAITGSVSNNAVVSPGTSPGLISMTGNYSEGPNAHLAIELSGTTPGTGYDQLSVGGAATLRGSLDVSFVNGFVPAPGNVFTVLVCNARSGVFTLNAPTNNLGAIYTARSVLLETGNASPVAQLFVDPFQLACHTFLLSASGIDPDGSVTNITLLLDTNVLAFAAAGSVQTSFSSDFPGDFTFTVLATDNKGASGGTNVTVHLATLPTLVLDGVGFQTNRAFKLCMLGETGTNYQVLASDDLTASNWLVLGTMENTNGIWRFSDATSTNSTHRFYRARQLP